MAQSKLPANFEQLILALPPADRLALATRLIASVEGPDPEWEDAWGDELDRRDAEMDSGAVVGIPWEEVRDDVLARLRARRSTP